MGPSDEVNSRRNCRSTYPEKLCIDEGGDEDGMFLGCLVPSSTNKVEIASSPEFKHLQTAAHVSLKTKGSP